MSQGPSDGWAAQGSTSGVMNKPASASLSCFHQQASITGTDLIADASPDQVFLAADPDGGLLLCLVSRHTMQLQALQLKLQPRGGDVAQATVCLVQAHRV